MDDFELELKNIFLEEASQMLADTEVCFLKLESTPDDPAIIEQIFRFAHSLKGSAKAVGFNQIGAFTHELESLLLKLKNGEIKGNKEVVSLLLKCNDHVRVMVDGCKANFDFVNDSSELLHQQIHQQMNAPLVAPMQNDSAPEFAPEPSLDSVPSADQFIEEPVQPISDPVLATSPVAEAVPTVPTASTPTNPAPANSSPTAAPTTQAKQAPTEESIRVSTARLEKLLNYVGELVILEAVIHQQATESGSELIRKTVHQLGKVTKEIQDISMSLRMVPIKPTFQKMQRIVRDTSSNLGKEVQFFMEGEDTELDKTVLELMSDPLVHLIRNAVDHGIESKEVRVKNGKTESGRVGLKAFQKGGSLIIQISDDGGGMDAERLRQKAVEKGILKPSQKLSDDQAYQLIFAPGFSTKAEVTDVSGRGVGMDVVKTNIERLQGEILIETAINKGSCFTIRLPLTLAIIEGMTIQLGQERFVLPLSHVHESVRPTKEDVKFTSGAGEILLLRGENLPLYRLSTLLGKSTTKQTEDSIAVVVRTSKQPFAVLLDDILGHQQIVIKKLGAEVQHLKGFSGSAILGDGKPALILELAELVNRQNNQNKRSAA